jgi:hypothetical protein
MREKKLDREGEALYSVSLGDVYRWFRTGISANLGRARNGGPTGQQSRRGAGRETGWAYEQSRNVL